MAATCGIGLNNAMASALNTLGDVHGGAGEQALECYHAVARRIDDGLDCINNFGQVMGRNIGRHADGNTGRAIDEEIGYPGRKHGGFRHRLVIVGNKINCFLIKIFQ